MPSLELGDARLRAWIGRAKAPDIVADSCGNAGIIVGAVTLSRPGKNLPYGDGFCQSLRFGFKGAMVSRGECRSRLDVKARSLHGVACYATPLSRNRRVDAWLGSK
jgi:hypothetical protein